MKKRWLILSMILLLLSGCTPGSYMTVPHSQEGSGHFNSVATPVSGEAMAGPFAEAYSGLLVYRIDENGHAFLSGPFGPKESKTQATESETVPPTLPEESSTQPSATETLPTASSEETRETTVYYTLEPPAETLVDIHETYTEPAETETTPGPDSAESTTAEPATQPSSSQNSSPSQNTSPTHNTSPSTATYRNGKTWTWVDVDLSAQMVYVYRGDTCIASFPCVTGSVIDGWATPTGTYSIQSKQRNRMLNGRSFVKYWMPFFRDYGLHDASWRDGNFRADQAWSYGSHGCVNLPEEGAKFIWDNCSVGDTVIVRGKAPDPGPHTGHDLSGEWEVEKEPTCTEAGRKIKLCPACHGIASSQILPAKGHNWVLSSDGRTQVCKTCKASEKVEETWSVTKDWYLKKEGEWGEWKESKAPTTEQEGEKYREKTDLWERELKSSFGNTKTESEERLEKETAVIPKLPPEATTTAVRETTPTPTTAAPTTAAPTTAAPTTAAPTTAAPTTAAPTTAAPTTAAPTTAAPTTAAPTTAAPTTTEATTTEAPTTAAPTTPEPTTPEPTTEPLTEPPTAPPTEPTTEPPTAPPTVPPTQPDPTTEAPTEPPTQPPTQPSTADQTLPDPSETGSGD